MGIASRWWPRHLPRRPFLTHSHAALRAVAGHHVGMAAHALSRERTEALRAASLTYEGVGATAQTAPPGYEALSRSRLMARRDFGSTVEDLMTWRVHEQAGLEVTASSPRVEDGAVLMLRLGVGALALRAPCRVVYVVDEPRRRGFAYGTLPGHPESGEELFVVHQRDDGHLRSRSARSPSTQVLQPRSVGPLLVGSSSG